MNTPELIVMLTNHDVTVPNAAEVFEDCKNSPAHYWGMKEKGLPIGEMKQLFEAFRACGKTGVLEVVAYTEEECLQGAKMAAECGCDMLLGTLFYDSVNDFCRKNGIKYMPFVGTVTGRPSVLEGNIEEIVAQAKECVRKGAYGVDLLGYRYRGDAEALSRALVEGLDAPVCIAGSINSFRRLDRMQEISPAFYTIGGAFFNHCFGEDIPAQINSVCRYMQKAVPVK